MPSIDPNVAFANDLMAHWIRRPMCRAAENVVAMRSTDSYIRQCLDREVAQPRAVARREREPGPVSAHAQAVSHEAVHLRRLGRCLHTWFRLADAHDTPLTEATCCEFVQLLLDLDRRLRREQQEAS